MTKKQTLKLGCVDAAEMPADTGQCTVPYHDWTGNPGSFRAEANNAWCSLTPRPNSQVATLQQHLKSMDFYPKGAADGIFGYRTISAVRLFQEYVRTIEGDSAIGMADGIAGKRIG